MKVEVIIRFTHSYIPPRCRKPRFEHQQLRASIPIREVSKDSVTLAFRVTEYDQDEREVIIYNRRLYRQVQGRTKREGGPLCRNVKAEDFSWQWNLAVYRGEDMTYDEHLALVKKKARNYIVIDGLLYEKCCEPYYSVTTFGLGRNHGGTGFFVSWANPIPKSVYGWSAIDHHAAIVGAVKVAFNRGDTESEEYIRASGNGSIQVFDPTAIKRKYDNPESHI